MATKQDVIRGVSMIVGVTLSIVIASHFFGWVGGASVFAVYCIWRAL